MIEILFELFKFVSWLLIAFVVGLEWGKVRQRSKGDE